MKKSGTMKKMLTYYKPYMRVFWTDMFFATLSAAVALIIPLVVRYVPTILCTVSRQKFCIRQLTLPLDCLRWWRLTVTANSTFVITDM